jgi:hypothetical protein
MSDDISAPERPEWAKWRNVKKFGILDNGDDDGRSLDRSETIIAPSP